MSLIYITCKDEKEAGSIANHLLDMHLIACANIFPVRSIFRWKGKIEDEKETALICKGFDFDAIARQVRSIHSYDLPAIIRIDSTSDKPFEEWARKETYSDQQND